MEILIIWRLFYRRLQSKLGNSPVITATPHKIARDLTNSQEVTYELEIAIVRQLG